MQAALHRFRGPPPPGWISPRPSPPWTRPPARWTPDRYRPGGGECYGLRRSPSGRALHPGDRSSWNLYRSFYCVCHHTPLGSLGCVGRLRPRSEGQGPGLHLPTVRADICAAWRPFPETPGASVWCPYCGGPAAAESGWPQERRLAPTSKRQERRRCPTPLASPHPVRRDAGRSSWLPSPRCSSRRSRWQGRPPPRT